MSAAACFVGAAWLKNMPKVLAAPCISCVDRPIASPVARAHSFMSADIAPNVTSNALCSSAASLAALKLATANAPIGSVIATDRFVPTSFIRPPIRVNFSAVASALASPRARPASSPRSSVVSDRTALPRLSAIRGLPRSGHDHRADADRRQSLGRGRRRVRHGVTAFGRAHPLADDPLGVRRLHLHARRDDVRVDGRELVFGLEAGKHGEIDAQQGDRNGGQPARGVAAEVSLEPGEGFAPSDVPGAVWVAIPATVAPASLAFLPSESIVKTSITLSSCVSLKR